MAKIDTLLEPEAQRRFRQTARALVNAAVDADGFAIAVQLSDELQDLLIARAAELTCPKRPKADRFTWAEMAQALGVTRQSAYERWHQR